MKRGGKESYSVHTKSGGGARSSQKIDRFDSQNILDQAEGFLKAVTLLCENSKPVNLQLLNPKYLNTCVTLELGLKAFLRGSGFSVADLSSRRKIGHDLIKALKAAEKKGLKHHLVFSKTERSAVGLINRYYPNELRYMTTGSKRYPQLRILVSLAERLLKKIRPFCEETRKKHYGKASAAD